MRTADGVEIPLRLAGPAGGPPVLLLSGGPGFVNYLPDGPATGPARTIAADPRGVGASGGGPHDLERALADLEEIRHHLRLGSWAVVGHSAGADLALAYAVEHPASVRAVVAACGTGVQNDRDWSADYHAAADTEPDLGIPYSADVHAALLASWREWIKEPDLLHRLAHLAVPVEVVVAGDDIRPSWPLRQVAALVPGASLTELPGVPHDLWHTHPDLWQAMVASAATRD